MTAIDISNEITSLVNKIKACGLSIKEKDALLSLMKEEASDASKDVISGFAEDMRRIARTRRKYG